MAVPDTAVPDTAVPDTAVLDTAAPTAGPGTAAPTVGPDTARRTSDLRTDLHAAAVAPRSVARSWAGRCATAARGLTAARASSFKVAGRSALLNVPVTPRSAVPRPLRCFSGPRSRSRAA